MGKSKQYKFIAIGLAVLIVAMAMAYLLMTGTLRSINETSEKEVLSLLSENAAQMDLTMENQLSNNWKQIDTVCVAMKHVNDYSSEGIAKYLSETLPDAYNTLLLSDDGSYIDSRGGKGQKEFRQDILPLIQGTEEWLTLLRQEGDIDLMTFAMKIKPISVDETKMHYIFVYYSLDSYLELLKMEAFEGKGQIRIIDSAGTTILHTDNLTESENRYMFFSTFKEAQFLNNSTITDSASFRERVLSGETDAVHVILSSGTDEIVSFSKIPDTDWHIIISIDTALATGTRTDAVNRIGMTALVAMLAIILISVILVILISSRSQKLTVEKNRELEILNEQMRENNKSLEVARKAAEKASKSAEKANKAKSTFLSNMSHDIRTPMNAVIGFANLGMSNADNPDKVRSYLSKILSSSSHLLSLINDILDMSRIESGKLTLEETQFNLSDLLRDIETIVGGQMQLKQLDFKMKAKNISNESIYCDSTRLKQVILNLLSNSIKFTPEGGCVSLYIEQSECCRPGFGKYEIRVKDTGIGMSKEFADIIFEPFERERNSTVSKTQGTGLGMSITKSIIDMMGGTIEVDTEEGKGTEFCVCLEIKVVADNMDQNTGDLNPKDLDTSVSETRETFKGKKILLAEDNELNREIAVEVLKGKGFEIDTANDGAIAVQMVENSIPGTYALVIMDIQMPNMDGHEATRRIRKLSDPDLASIPIIAMTANAFNEDRKAAIEVGMDDYITKPIDIDETMKTINNLLYKK